MIFFNPLLSGWLRASKNGKGNQQARTAAQGKVIARVNLKPYKSFLINKKKGYIQLKLQMQLIIAIEQQHLGIDSNGKCAVVIPQ